MKQFLIEKLLSTYFGMNKFSCSVLQIHFIFFQFSTAFHSGSKEIKRHFYFVRIRMIVDCVISKTRYFHIIITIYSIKFQIVKYFVEKSYKLNN